MPTPSLIVVKFPAASGIAADTVENMWNVILPSAPISTTELATATAAIHHFYALQPSGAPAPLSDYLSQTLSRAGGAVEHECYDLTVRTTPGIGSPVATFNYTLPAMTLASFSMPSELAICLSFHSATSGVPEHAPGGTRPKARRRGRTYIGPWAGNSFTDTGPPKHTPKPNGTILTIMQKAATALLNELVAAGIQWAVHSRVDNLFRSVTGGWVDDAIDIQRRRGELPEVRDTFGSLSRSEAFIEVASNPVR